MGGTDRSLVFTNSGSTDLSESDYNKLKYNNPAWDDLDHFTTGKAQKQKLVGQIRARVKRGETLMLNQPITELKN